MAEKPKMITKSGEEKDYEIERKRMQKVSFAKIQEILQQNVKKTYSKTFTTYTKDLLTQYIASPISNIDNIREISRFLTRYSMVYKKIVSYYATMYLYNYNITPILDMTKSINSSKTIKGYQSVLQTFEPFNMKKEAFNIITSIIRDGIYVGFTYNTNGIMLMLLDPQYCRIYGKNEDGQWIVYFNAAYFANSSNGIYVDGIDGDTSGCWDKVFIDGWNAYQKDRQNAQWFRLPPERTCCIVSYTDDEFYMPLPYFLPIFRSLLQLLSTEDIIAEKTELQNYKLLLGKIPLLNGSDNVDDFSISLELVNQFQQLLEGIVPDLVGVGTTPLEFETIDFNSSTSTADTDELNDAMNNLFANAGINKLIVSSGDSSNANGIKYSIANDTGNISIYIRRLESWLNYYIKMNISEGYSLQIFDQTWYNSDDFVTRKKDAATLGGSAMDYLIAESGCTPYMVWNKINFENLLGIKDIMFPLKSSYTQSNKTVGAPKKDESEISDEGQATRDSGKNEDKGN